MPRRADHPGGVRPLLSRGRRVVVDGAPICATCGQAVLPTGLDRWRHVPAGRRFTGRSRWLSPATLTAVCESPTYAELVRRFPGVARTTTEAEWLEGRRRLVAYAAALDSVRRRRSLRRDENPYLDLVGMLAAPAPLEQLPGGHFGPPAAWNLPLGLAAMLDLGQRRRELVALFAWAIPNADALGTIARYAPILECGAGMAYWTALLQAGGVDAVAYDARPPGEESANEYHPTGGRPWTSVTPGASATAVRSHVGRTLLICWPPYDDEAASYSVLRSYRGEILLYIGEGPGGATGTARFHRELALNWTLLEQVDLPRWPWTTDRLVVYRRNPVRRPHTVRDRCFECGRFLTTGSIGRCDRCVECRPPALALQQGRHRLEYSAEMLANLPPALRWALERSSNRIR